MRQHLWLCLLIAALAGCANHSTTDTTLTLATTTSTRDTGLLDYLLPIFREQTGIDVKVVAVGSGQALEIGRRGDADVLLTHAPLAEEAFMAAGHGSERRAVMYNEFVIVGPADDPADLQGLSVVKAFQKLTDEQVTFVSRGDESGTHKKEQQLWTLAQRKPQGDWYIQAGSGMAETLRMADQKNAYTLTDRGTYLSLQDNLRLAIVVQQEPPLENHYSVIIVSAERYPQRNVEAAQQFADFLTSPETQQQIGSFGKAQFGEPLFHPEASTIEDASP